MRSERTTRTTPSHSHSATDPPQQPHQQHSAEDTSEFGRMRRRPHVGHGGVRERNERDERVHGRQRRVDDPASRHLPSGHHPSHCSGAREGARHPCRSSTTVSCGIPRRRRGLHHRNDGRIDPCDLHRRPEDRIRKTRSSDGKAPDRVQRPSGPARLVHSASSL
jgi:hypothetical protein